MSKHKKQHYVPKSYLTAWVDPEAPEDQEAFIWLFPRDGGAGKRRAPKNVFWESEMYTLPLPGGGRDLSLEHGLQSLETEFAKVRRQLLANEGLTADEQAVVCLFAAALHARTVRQRDHVADQWGGVLEKMRVMDQDVRSMTPEERDALPPSIPGSGPSMSMEDVERIVAEPVQSSLVPAILSAAPILAEMNLTLLWTEDPQGFITSDAPCAFFDPDVHSRPFPYNSIGFAYKTLEISLPISPRVTALFSWQDLSDRMDVSGRGVAELNRRTRFLSHREFVNSEDRIDPYWFDPREDLKPGHGSSGPDERSVSPGSS